MGPEVKPIKPAEEAVDVADLDEVAAHGDVAVDVAAEKEGALQVREKGLGSVESAASATRKDILRKNVIIAPRRR